MAGTKAPLVSVNMVVHNGERFVSEAIQSILIQTYSNFELVIVDDGSRDKTVEKIRNFNDSRIKLLVLKNNQGVVAARNVAIKASIGDYIAILDADDISLPDRLEIEVRFLEENPGFGLIGGRAELIGMNGEKLNRTQSISLTPEETKVLLLFKNCFTHSTVMYKKRILKKLFFNQKFPGSEDYDAIVKISFDSKIKNLDRVLAQYRLHSSNISRNDELIKRNNRKIIGQQLSWLGIDANAKNIKIHSKLEKKPIHPDLQLILDKTAWLDKLFSANRKMKVFPETEFYNRLSGYWFNLMNNPVKYNMKLFRPYLKSPILKSSNRTFMDHLKFTIKCFLRYKLMKQHI